MPSGNSIPTVPSLCIACGQFRGSNSIGELDLNPPRLCIACQRFESMRFPVSVSDRHRFNFGETFTALDPSECNGCGKFRGPKSIGELDSNRSKPVNRVWTVQRLQFHRGTRFQPFQACVSRVDSSEAPIPSGNSISTVQGCVSRVRSLDRCGFQFQCPIGTELTSGKRLPH